VLVSRVRIVAAATACVLGVAAGSAAIPARAQAPNPEPLWYAFPIDPGSGGGGRHGAAPRPTTPQKAKRAAAANATMAAAPRGTTRRGSRSTLEQAFWVVTAVGLGMVAGLIAALLPALVVERHRRRASACPPPRAARPAPSPRGARLAAASGAVARDAWPAAPVVQPLRTPVPAWHEATAPTFTAKQAARARDRHGALYDAEYAKQLRRIDALRRSIGLRLAGSEVLQGDEPRSSASDAASISEPDD
jgi:hypothetical protein